MAKGHTFVLLTHPGPPTKKNQLFVFSGRAMARNVKTKNVAPSHGRRSRNDNRREQLLDAAARLFAEQGFRATTIRDIGAAIDMLPGSVYYHFTSKQELLVSVVEEGVLRNCAYLDAAIAGRSDPWERLEAACIAHLESLLDRRDYAQVLIRVIPADAGEVAGRLIALRDEFESRYASLIDDLPLPAGVDRRRLRLMLIGALNWTLIWYRPGGDDPADIARDFVRFLRQAPSTWDTDLTLEESK